MITPVRDLMTSQVERIQVTAPFADAVRIMFERRLSCLLIDDKEKTIGIVTERDLTKTLNQYFQGVPPGSISDVMTTDLITIQSDSDFSEAINLLKIHKIRRLVVTEETGEVCGLLTRADLLSAQKSILEKKVQQRTRQLEKSNEALEKLSVTDAMLNVGNRRAMDAALTSVFQSAKRYHRPNSIVLFDIDLFKPFNDFYGHQSGDEVLKAVASVVKKNIRTTDSVYRYGGEEFLVLLPETNLDGAMIAAEHMRLSVENTTIQHEKSPFGIVTASFGVSALDTTEPDHQPSISEADAALYLAKENGRNRIESQQTVHEKNSNMKPLKSATGG